MSIDKHSSSQQNDNAKKLALPRKEAEMHIETESTHITLLKATYLSTLSFHDVTTIRIANPLSAWVFERRRQRLHPATSCA